MEHLQNQNALLKASMRFWRAVTLAAVLVCAVSASCMTGEIVSLRMQLRTAEQEYHIEAEKAERIRTLAVNELTDMAVRLAHYETAQEQDIEYHVFPLAAEISESELEYIYLGKFTITAYCNDPYDHICGSCDGLTAMGIPAEPGIIAVDPSVIELGSHVIIDGQEYLAADTGGAIKGNRIDMLVAGGHDKALEFGVQKKDVYIVRCPE